MNAAMRLCICNHRYSAGIFVKRILSHIESLNIPMLCGFASSACWGGVLQWVLQESHLQPFAWSDESTLPRVACQPFSVPFRLWRSWRTSHWFSNGNPWKHGSYTSDEFPIPENPRCCARFASMAVRYFDVWSFTEQVWRWNQRSSWCHPDVIPTPSWFIRELRQLSDQSLSW